MGIDFVIATALPTLILNRLGPLMARLSAMTRQGAPAAFGLAQSALFS